jgi:hypothetical protein
MDEHGGGDVERQSLMVLRKVSPERHHLARSMTGPAADTSGGTWWELVDAAAAADLPSVAVALTHAGPDGRVTVSALGARDDDAAEEYEELLRALVAALRSRTADSVVVQGRDAAMAKALVAVGFTPAVDGKTGDRYIIAL